MGNRLTGDFEAVLEVSVRQLNGLLATLHQNGADKNASPTFLHSQEMRLEDEDRKIDPIQAGTREWVGSSGGSYVSVHHEDGSITIEPSKVPPGVSGPLNKVYTATMGTVTSPPASSAVSGTAQVQISTPTLTVAHGSTSELTVSLFIRAHYVPDNGSRKLPGPVHGEVQITYSVTKANTPSGPKLKAVPPSDDNKIQFFPESGTLNSAEANEIAQHIRQLTRKNFKPTEVSLPHGFSFSTFRGLAGNASDPATQSLALPLALSGGAPSGNVHSIANSLLNGQDFAIAVSKEYVNGIFQRMLDSVKAAVEAIRVIQTLDLAVFSVTATYVGQVISGPEISWKDGGLELFAHIRAHTDSKAPDADFRVRQGLTLTLDASVQSVYIDPSGEPSVEFKLSSLEDVVPGSIQDEIKAKLTQHFKSLRDQALRSASPLVERTFAGALDSLRGGLRSFDSSAVASFRSLHITPDGIVVRGNIGTPERTRPYVRFREVGDGYNALESWVPGGRAKKYIWSAAGTKTRVFEGGIHVADFSSIMPVSFGNDPQGFDRHGFVRSKPNLDGGNTRYSQVCLSVEGSQISPDGRLIEGDEISGFHSIGGTCIPLVDEPILFLPKWWKTLRLPWWAYPGPVEVEVPLESLITLHFDAVSDVPLDSNFATNTVLFFADMNSRSPLAGLSNALSQASLGNVSLSVVVVLPAGSFKLTRKEFDAKMGLSDGALQANAALPAISLQFTEDHGGEWSSTFDVKGSSAMAILNARGEFAWKQDGEVEPRAFGEALEMHALPAAAPRSRLMPSMLLPGDMAPDFAFEDDQGEYNELRHMRGRPLILNFWQSWSQPSMGELARLQTLHEKGGANAPYIVGHAGDRDAKVLNEVKQANRLTFALSHDANRSLAQQFRVRCWPTTISINPEGIIEHIQYGASPQGRTVPS